MKIYQQEINDGIADLVKSQASIAYCTTASVASKASEQDAVEIEKIIAGKSNPDQIDLYYLESVLVSTGWNKNDDVFMPESTWAARSTPEDKQFNFMHNENDIIGHITSSYVLDKEGNKISADQDESPKDFDIITEAVLYNSWTDPENRERMSQIIAEIEEGKWFVSMECLFSDFDYALIGPEGNNHVVARSDESSFLTKHLRAYGGEGQYEGYTVGRALKNIAFSGKGLVSNPANPRSVILEKSRSFIINEDMSNFSIGDISMSDNNSILEQQITNLKEDLAVAKAENEAMKQSVEEAKDKEFATTIEAFEADVQSKDEAIANLEETVKSTQAKIAELEDALATSQEELETTQKQIAEMVQKEKTAARKTALTEAGLALFGKKPKKKKDEEEEAKDDTKAEEVEAEEAEAEEAEAELEEAFEEVETTEATLVDATNEEDELASSKAEIADWLSNNVFSK